jgi:hypothetical protein
MMTSGVEVWIFLIPLPSPSFPSSSPSSLSLLPPPSHSSLLLSLDLLSFLSVSLILLADSDVDITLGPLHVFFDRSSIMSLVYAGSDFVTSIAEFIEREKIVFAQPKEKTVAPEVSNRFFVFFT